MIEEDVLHTLKNEIQADLLENIIPFWSEYIIEDDDRDGFINRMTYDGRVINEADKSIVLHSRLLWSYSACYKHTGQERLKKLAYRAYHYLNRYFWDEKNGGVYWKLNANGRVLVSRKYLYAQAFALYGYSEFYGAFNQPDALLYVRDIVNCIEKYAADANYNGYVEVFTDTWQKYDDARLSDEEENYTKSTNTHLHIMEAYANVLKYWKDDRLKQRLHNIVSLFESHIARPDHQSLYPFFYMDWTPASDLVSFGHNIEAAWLLCEAAELAEDNDQIKRIRELSLNISRWVANHGLNPDGSLINELDLHGNGRMDDKRHWWPQAEALVGFMNAYELSEDDIYLDKCRKLWAYIKNNIRDDQFGEWHNCINADGTNCKEDKVSFWKTPYHNSRAGLEIIKRIEQMVSTQLKS